MSGDKLLWSNAVIACGAAACVLRSWKLAMPDTPTDTAVWAFALGIGAATWWAYGWQRYVKGTRPDGLRENHQAWLLRRRRPLIVTALLLAPLAASPVLSTARVLTEQPAVNLWLPAILLLAGLLTALYAGVPGKAGMRFALRRLPRMKLLWIGFAWAGITAGWPVWWACSGHPDLHVTGWLVLERGCIIMALTLPFDLRDVHWDPPALRTIPQRWGATATRLSAVALLAVAAWSTLHIQGLNHAVLLGPTLMVPAVLLAAERRSSWYYLTLDGLLIVDGLCSVLLL